MWQRRLQTIFPVIALAKALSFLVSRNQEEPLVVKAAATSAKTLNVVLVHGLVESLPKSCSLFIHSRQDSLAESVHLCLEKITGRTNLLLDDFRTFGKYLNGLLQVCVNLVLLCFCLFGSVLAEVLQWCCFDLQGIVQPCVRVWKIGHQ